MLVDSVFVEEITDHAAADLLEIREYFSEQAHFMHRKQCIVYTLAILHHVQNQAAGLRMIRQNAVGRCYPLADGSERGRIETRFFPMRFSKSLDHVEGIRK